MPHTAPDALDSRTPCSEVSLTYLHRFREPSPGRDPAAGEVRSRNEYTGWALLDWSFPSPTDRGNAQSEAVSPVYLMRSRYPAVAARAPASVEPGAA